MLDRLLNRPNTFFLFNLVNAALTILVLHTSELVAEGKAIYILMLVISYGGVILAYTSIYRSLKEDETPTVKNFKTVKR
jgi:hypothetical protein